MARTRGGLIGNRGRGRGRGRDRGRGRGVQPERVQLVELANIVSRSRPLQEESSPSLASVGNERDEIPNVRAGSVQGSSMSAASASIFEQVPRRARNVYYAPPPEIPRDVPNPPAAPVV